MYKLTLLLMLVAGVLANGFYVLGELITVEQERMLAGLPARQMTARIPDEHEKLPTVIKETVYEDAEEVTPNPEPVAEVLNGVVEEVTEETITVEEEQEPLPVEEVAITEEEEKEIVTEEVVEIIPQPTSPATFEDKLTAEILYLTNAQRQKKGLSSLVLDSGLNAIAERYSEDMLRRNFFAHIDPDGCDLSCRYKRAGYEARVWAENLAQLHDYKHLSLRATAQEFMDLWMGSGGHRKNILDERYTNIGIGIAKSNNHLTVTVEFSKPK